MKYTTGNCNSRVHVPRDRVCVEVIDFLPLFQRYSTELQDCSDRVVFWFFNLFYPYYLILCLTFALFPVFPI